jgi:hypothetical protein
MRETLINHFKNNRRVWIFNHAPNHPMWKRTPYFGGDADDWIAFITALATDRKVWAAVEGDNVTVYIWRTPEGIE